MYNRYIPQPDGSWQKSRIPEKRPPAPPAPPPEPPGENCPELPPPPPRQPPRVKGPTPRPRPPYRSRPAPEKSNVTDFLRQLLPKNFDTGDLLVILLLLLMCGDSQEDQNTALLTMALYFFL